jgi:uncharacterized membrane protein
MTLTFSERLKRVFRHWRTTAGVARRAFPPEGLSAIGAAINAGEQRHRSELRFIVEASMPSAALWNDMTNRQRALALFAEYGVWDTEDNCGVLIYVNLAEHKIDIVVDRNVARKIDQSQWQAVCDTMTQGFRQGEFEKSTLLAIEAVNALLEQHFPSNGARANELPDHPIML